jgi:hypothetical protein
MFASFRYLFWLYLACVLVWLLACLLACVLACVRGVLLVYSWAANKVVSLPCGVVSTRPTTGRILPSKSSQAVTSVGR